MSNVEIAYKQDLSYQSYPSPSDFQYAFRLQAWYAFAYCRFLASTHPLYCLSDGLSSNKRRLHRLLNCAFYIYNFWRILDNQKSTALTVPLIKVCDPRGGQTNTQCFVTSSISSLYSRLDFQRSFRTCKNFHFPIIYSRFT